jgi:hypothetical protein
MKFTQKKIHCEEWLWSKKSKSGLDQKNSKKSGRSKKKSKQQFLKDEFECIQRVC